MDAGRLHGRRGACDVQHGVSLIELLVTMAILAGMLAMALPAFAEWIRNNQIRVAAETLREGLQLARSEAVKRNTRVRLQLVTSLDASCALSTAGPYWVINAGSAVTPAGSCNSAISDTVSPYILQKSPVTSATTKVAVLSSSNAVVAFDASGRVSSTLNPTVTAPTTTTINLSMSGQTCAINSGTTRCLRVVVYPAGEVRMCDPSQTSTTDPTRC